MSKGNVILLIPIIGRVRTIWDEGFFKLRVLFDGLIRGKKVFLEYIQYIEKYIDMVAEIVEVKSSVAFEFSIDEDFIEFC